MEILINEIDSHFLDLIKREPLFYPFHNGRKQIEAFRTDGAASLTCFGNY